MIVETIDKKYISITRVLMNLKSSIEAKMYSMWCALTVAKSDPRIARIKMNEIADEEAKKAAEDCIMIM